MSRASGISISTGQRIVANDLHMSSCAMHCHQPISPATQAVRLLRCQAILQDMQNVQHGIRIWIDEACFNLSPYKNSRMHCVISVTAGDVLGDGVLPLRKTAGQMILAAWASDGWSYCFLFWGNVNSQHYCDAMNKCLQAFKWSHPLARNGHMVNCRVYANGASPPHTSHVSMAHVGAAVAALEPGSRLVWHNEWPPYSPDCIPLDYARFHQLKTLVMKRVELTSLTQLQRRIPQKFRVAFPQDYVREMTSKFRGRLEKVVAANGGYVERNFSWKWTGIIIEADLALKVEADLALEVEADLALEVEAVGFTLKLAHPDISLPFSSPQLSDGTRASVYGSSCNLASLVAWLNVHSCSPSSLPSSCHR